MNFYSIEKRSSDTAYKQHFSLKYKSTGTQFYLFTILLIRIDIIVNGNYYRCLYISYVINIFCIGKDFHFEKENR